MNRPRQDAAPSGGTRLLLPENAEPPKAPRRSASLMAPLARVLLSRRGIAGMTALCILSLLVVRVSSGGSDPHSSSSQASPVVPSATPTAPQGDGRTPGAAVPPAATSPVPSQSQAGAITAAVRAEMLLGSAGMYDPASR